LDFLINLPALNIHGINSAGTGAQARNVIPTAATATIGLRLVKGTDYRKMQDLVIDHIRRQGYLVADSEPDEQVLRSHPKVCRVRRRDGYNAVRAPMDLDICKRVVSAIQSVHGDVVLMPTLGGSLPIAPIQEIMGAPVVVVPIANHDNNQHGHDENMRLRNLWDGIETMAALFAMR
jgi:acetylornithine deacetylase/succinyl-diaminopimelate desuccinylase-like protein